MSGVKSNLWIKKIASALFIIISVWWGLHLTSPPSPKSADMPATEFSAERAFRHVQAISQRPHMLGTAAHDSVQSYIINELKTLGLNPTVEEAISSSGHPEYRFTRIQNIVARMEGSDPERTIMLMAHYDTVPYSPGAADDASGVSTILETVRALKAGKPLKNNIVILLTDGEELGLIGARQFAESNPLMEEIDLILNMEARGSSGSSILFETNSHNSKLIPLFAEATTDPVANSLTYSVYQVLPNDTDFSVFKPYDIQGLNFAYIKSYLNYHTMQDTPENLSLSSLQHHGDNMLANLRHFGNQAFDLSADSDHVYFNDPFGGIIYYPQGWVPYLSLLTALLFLFATYVTYRNNRASLKKSLLGFAAYFGVLLVSVAICWFGWDIMTNWIFPEYNWLQHAETYAHSWYLGLFIGIISLITIPFLRWTIYKINISNLLAGIYLTSVILLITLTVFLPGGSYLLTWPVAFGLVGWILTGDKLEKDELSWQTLGIISLSLFAVFFLFPFYIQMIHVTLTTRLVAISIILFLLVLGLSWPLVDYVVPTDTRLFLGLVGGFIIICFAGAVLNSSYSSDQKKQNSLIYAIDQDTGNSYWLSIDHTSDEWTSHFLGTQPTDTVMQDFGNIRSDKLLYSEAPTIDISSPQIELIEDRPTSSLRHLSIRFQHTRPANIMTLNFSNPDDIVEASLGDKRLFSELNPLDEQPERFSRLSYYQDMSSPFTLHLTLRSDSSSMEIETVNYHLALPGSLMQNYPARPAHTMPKPFGYTTGTIWKRSVHIDEL